MPAKKARSPKAPDRHVTTMRMRKELLNKIDAEAFKRGMSRTALVDHVLAEFLNSIGRKTKLEPQL